MFEKGNNCGVTGGLSQEKLRPKVGLMKWKTIYRELRTVFSPPWTSHPFHLCMEKSRLDRFSAL